MPLSPSPLLPGTSPLPTPGHRPPARRALQIGALITVPLLVISLVVGQLGLVNLAFLASGLLSSTQAGNPGGAGGTTFQGFVYPWTKDMKGGGYSTSASLTNMQSQAKDFNMNAVIIPVVADMPYRSNSTLNWTTSKGKYILPDSDYVQAIQDARKAGLVPILELVVRQNDPLNKDDTSPLHVGEGWQIHKSTDSITREDNEATENVGSTEKSFFDNYTAFAVHFAQMSQQYHLPYFIIGDQMASVTWDNTTTNAKGDTRGIDHGVPGEDTSLCVGRRDCEWRHVIHAIKVATYATLNGHKQNQTGGGYTGKLIYAASCCGVPQGVSDLEFQKITWWDAVDYIGVDAYFPLTQNADVAPEQLEQAWSGQGENLLSKENVVDDLSKVATTTNKPVVFTAAGYASMPSSNGNPKATGGSSSAIVDNSEQENDMEALYYTFVQQSWWAGVFWYADYPISPRSQQPNWSTSSNWAGDSLDKSKAAGLWLADVYEKNPIPCDC